MSTRNLPFHELVMALGVNTQSRPESRAGKTLLLGDNVDGFDQFQSVGKVPGSSRQSPDHGSPVVSVNHVEFQDLDLVRKRHQLTLAGGEIRRVVDQDTLLELSGSFSAFVNERLRGASLNDRLHLTSPNQRQLPTGGVKWDGSNLRNWGTLAPGQVETIQLPLDSSALWSTTSTDVTVEDQSVSQDGGGSVQMNKVGTADFFAWIERSGLGLDLSTVGAAAFNIWLFVPAGALQKMASSGAAVQIQLGDTNLANSDFHDFSVGSLVPGWNLLALVLTSPSASAGTGADLSAVDTFRLRVNFLDKDQTQSGFYWDKGHTFDEGALTATSSGTGAVVGTVSYVTVFLTEAGLNSNAGSASTPVSALGFAAAGTLSLTGQPLDTETVTIDGTSYTFQTVLVDTVANNVFIGPTTNDSLNNLKAAINIETGAGTLFSTPTAIHGTVTATRGVGNTLIATAKTAGTAGNAIITIESLTDGSWASGTLLGGFAGNTIALTDVPVSPDAQVIARQIYRDTDNDQVFRFVGQIDDNVTTVFTDNVSAGGLGGANAPFAGDSVLDSSPPGRGRAVEVFNNRVFLLDADDKQTIAVSDVGSPEAFRIVDQLRLEEEITAIESHIFGLVIYGTDKIFLLTGDNLSRPFRIDETSNETGANGPFSAVRVKGVNFTLRETEAFLISDPTNPWFLNGQVLDQFQTLAQDELENAHVVHDRSRFSVVMFAKGTSGGNFDRIFRYQYGTLTASQITGEGPGTDPQDLRIGSWYTMTLPTAVNPLCSEMVERAADVPELWIGAADGFIYYLNDPVATDWAVGLGSEPVAAALETNAVPIGSGNGGRGQARYVTFNYETNISSTWTVTIKYFTDGEGQALGSIATPVTFQAGRGSRTLAVSATAGRGQWCSVRLENAAAGENGFVKNLSLFYIPRVDFRGRKLR